MTDTGRVDDGLINAIRRAVNSGQCNNVGEMLTAAADRINELEQEVSRLRGALGDAVKIIDEHVPEDALGYDSQGDFEVPGGVHTWPIKDEYLSSFRQALGGDDGKD